MLRRLDRFLHDYGYLHARPALGWSAAAALVAAAIGLRLLLGDLLQGVYYLTVFPSVALSALIGGAGAGIFALVLGGLGAWFVLMHPSLGAGWPSPSDLLSLGGYALVGAMEVFLISLLVSSARRNAELAVQNAELAHHRAVLLRELQHRVKNNLQMLSSVVSFAAGKASPELRPQFDDVARRIAAIARAHEQIGAGGDPSRLDLARYVEELCRTAGTAFGRDGIRLRTELAPVSGDLDTALPLGLIVNELVTNAYKHAFPPGRDGELLVRLVARDGWCELTVRDGGEGLKSDVRDGAAGLRLARALAAQVRGELTTGNRPEGGAEFRLRFPLAAARPAEALLR